MLQAERVSGFVQAGEIDDRVAQQPVVVHAKRRREHVDFGPALAVHPDRSRFAVQALLRGSPQHADARVLAILNAD